MTVQNAEPTAPNAPHGTNGVTSTSKPYNDWPNDAGVRQCFSNPSHFRLMCHALVRDPPRGNRSRRAQSIRQNTSLCRVSSVQDMIPRISRETEAFSGVSSTARVLVVINSPPPKTKPSPHHTGSTVFPRPTASSSLRRPKENSSRTHSIIPATPATSSSRTYARPEQTPPPRLVNYETHVNPFSRRS